MNIWQATYYVVNRYGRTEERVRNLGPAKQPSEVRKRMDSFIRRLNEQGHAVLAQYDLEERRA
jgi:hypothetical protein